MSTSVLAIILAISIVCLGVSLVALGLTSARLASARIEVAGLKKRVGDRSAPTPLAERAVKVVAHTAHRVREGGVGGFLMSSVDDLTRWVMEDRTGISRVAGPDGAVTILFSDIENSTALNEKIGDTAWVNLLDKHDGIVRASVNKHKGHIVKSQGDGFMIVFPNPMSAISAGIVIQRKFEASRGRRLRHTPIRVRMGIHEGPAIEKGGDFFGRNVAMAARVAAQADGGEILVSDDVRVGLPDGSGIQLIDYADVELKGFDNTHTLWLIDRA